ncbi:MAG: aconitase X catalytic domain-containing protein [Burkholderiales bacterium]|nr:aconitase X catalytic domain-containing protein [Burkholderiales bacterium]
MILTKEEEQMLNGECGPGVAKAMDMIVKWGEVYDAPKLVEVTSTHTLLGEPVEWLRDVSEGAKVRTLSTLHVVNFDYERWEEQGIQRSEAEQQKEYTGKCMPYYESLGLIKSFSCGPYLIGNVPRQGDYINWSGSSGVLLANSLFGARCPRVGASGSLASAVTGRAPLVAELTPASRHGKVLVEPDGFDPDSLTKEDIGLYGYYVGGVAGEKTCVFTGFGRRLSVEEVKFLASPLGVSGSSTMLHIVGLTPEAPTVEAAFGNKPPEATIRVGKHEMNLAWISLNTTESRDVDLVTLGCPHLSITELREVARLLEGRRVLDSKRLWISCGFEMYNLARRMGYIDTIERAGGTVLTGCCAGPLTPWDKLVDPVAVVGTNSARAAAYINMVSGGKVKTRYGSAADCIDSIVGGKWHGRERWVP